MAGSTSADRGRARGQASRFDAAFDAHYLKVLAFAIRRMESRAEAEDVAAETFAVAWRRRDAIPDAPLPWLYAVALRVIANHRRSSRRRARRDQRFASESVHHSRDPAEIVESRDEIAAALASLTEQQREALRLVAWEGLDQRTAASVVGCSPATFRVRLHRARRALGKHLGLSGHSADEQPVAPTPCRAAEETK
jgi:RNA polymerase sigma-70 factor (ECF subfamily)